MTMTVEHFVNWYGDGLDGASPTEEQWRGVLTLPSEKPLTLINFFKFRDVPQYDDGNPVIEKGDTGASAFELYATVSVPTMQRCGGSFLHVGPFAGSFIGSDEDWDLVAVGTYPNLDALIALYSDTAYRQAYTHRTAACSRQKVWIAGVD